jgi:hypothetical protein
MPVASAASPRAPREKVLIVTPRQRFYRITFDYHLHFFYRHHLPSWILPSR